MQLQDSALLSLGLAMMWDVDWVLVPLSGLLLEPVLALVVAPLWELMSALVWEGP